jgi:hydrogenase-4 transcriptional activator
MNVIFDVWREVGRHLEIAESVERLLPRLAEELPIEALAVRRIDRQGLSLETVACGIVGELPPLFSGKTKLTDGELVQLLAWCGRGDVATKRAGQEASDALDMRWCGIDRTRDGAIAAREMLIGPLSSEDGTPLGLVLAAAVALQSFSQENVELFRQLLEPFAAALENDSRLRELRSLREALEADKQALLTRLDRQDITDSIVGAETGLRLVMERAEQVAASDVPVLILGETGSGKEVIARAIHHRSRRAEGPILRVNCGAIPPELVDSELFGHERGSFTGADSTRKGWFERADGGTLFLDEIGDLPPAAQVRLLRVLQDGSFERVGGHTPITVDVRLVAATNADLHALIAQGRFREDLWYRISVFPIHLPPLRQRPADIPAFAAHFAARAGKRLAGRALVPTDRDVALLLAYPWPGNVRELAAVIERAAILGNGRRLEIAQALGPAPPNPSVTPPTVSEETVLAAAASAQIANAETGPAKTASVPAGEAAAGQSLDQAMVEHIERTLAATLGRVEGPFGAAKALGVNPHTLRSRMRKLGIDWTRFRIDAETRRQS